MEFKTVNIKGKEYVQVNERLKFFRDKTQFKEDYTIETTLLESSEKYCIFKAEIKTKDGIVVSSGHAQEFRDASYINKTAYVENCETSAIGRALGILGIGIETSIATSDEVEAKIKQQEEQEKEENKDYRQDLEVVVRQHNRDLAKMNNYINKEFNSPKKINKNIYLHICKILDDVKKDEAKKALAEKKETPRIPSAKDVRFKLDKKPFE